MKRKDRKESHAKKVRLSSPPKRPAYPEFLGGSVAAATPKLPKPQSTEFGMRTEKDAG